MVRTTEQWQEAAKRAKSTATMANTLAKALAKRHGGRWNFVGFVGSTGAESGGIVDLMAIKKNGRPPSIAGLKRLDVFDIILIQVKGGSARSPTLVDIDRLRTVGKHYGALDVVLFEWSKEKRTGWSVLSDGGTWESATAARIFGG